MPLSKKDRINYSLNVLPVLLCLIPLLIVNFGYSSLKKIDRHWERVSLKENVRQELQRLSSEGKFKWLFGQKAGKLKKIISDSVILRKNASVFSKTMSSKIGNVLQSSFPEYDLFVFRRPALGKKSRIIFSNRHRVIKRVAKCKIFDYFLDISQKHKIPERNIRQLDKLVNVTLGPRTLSDILANSQRGKASYVIYKRCPSIMLWDYFKAEDKDTYGFFFIAKSEPSNEIFAEKIALKNFKKIHPTWEMGYISLLKDSKNDVITTKLKKSFLFQSWRKKQFNIYNNHFSKYMENGEPNDIIIGNYNFFSYLGKQSGKLNVVGLPKLKPARLPVLLKLINILVLVLVIFTLARGFITNKWMNISLKLRFFVTFVLSATMPVSLFIVGGYGYLKQLELSEKNRQLAKLKTTLQRFDDDKLQFIDKYKSLFYQVCEDKKLIKLLNDKSLDGEKLVKKRINNIFKKKNLPFLGFGILDAYGKRIRVFKRRDSQEVISNFKAVEYPLILALRANVEEKENKPLPKLKVEQYEELGLKVYEAFTHLKLDVEFERRRGFVISRKVGAATLSQLHDYINVDGRAKYFCVLFWKDNALDKRILKNTIDVCGINSPEINLLAFKKTPQGLFPLLKADRHESKEFRVAAKKVAEMSSVEGGYISSFSGGYSIVALSPKKYSDTVVVAGISQYRLKKLLEERAFWLFVILIFSIVAIIIPGFLVAKMVLLPIMSITEAIGRIINGDLSLEIETKRTDELGGLAKEFTSMTRGLRERAKIASLVSEQALEAISAETTDLTDKNSFRGVIFVSDIRNFTGLCERYDTKQITDMLNTHFEALTLIISSYGGKVYKFIGDAVEAVFPEKEGVNACEQAVAASAEIISKILEINALRINDGLFEYKIGVGLSYGELVSGEVGSKETRLDYAVIGEPLKIASLLESASKQVPEFPVVIDKLVKNNLPKDKNIEFTKVESEEFACYSFSSTECLKFIGQKVSVEKNEDYADDLAKTRKYFIFEFGGDKLTAAVAFAFGIFILVVSLYFTRIGLENFTSSKFKQQKDELIEKSMLMKSKLHSEASLQLAFEQRMRALANKISSGLSFVDEEQNLIDLESLSKSGFENLKSENINLDRFAVFGFKQKEMKYSPGNNINNAVYAVGMASSELNIFEKICLWRVCKNRDLFNEFNKYGKELFGVNGKKPSGGKSGLYSFLSENTGSVSVIEYHGEREFFFWQYLVKFSPDYLKHLVSNGKVDVGNIDKKQYKIIGILVASKKIKTIAEPANYIIRGFKEPGVYLKICSGEKTWMTAKYPNDIEVNKNSLNNNSFFVSNGYLLSNGEIRIGNQLAKFSVAYKMPSKYKSRYSNFKNLILIITLLMFIYWLKIFLDKSILKDSLHLKLLLASISPAIIPLLSLFIVGNFFLLEQKNTEIFQEKVNLKSFIDRIERREFFPEPLMWNFFESFSRSPDLRSAFSTKSNLTDGQKLHLLKQLIEELISDVKKRYGHFCQFSPKKLIIISSNGKNYSWTANSKVEESKGTEEQLFDELMSSFGKGLMKSLSNKPKESVVNNKLKPADIKNSMLVDTGMVMARSSFGDDNYMKMSNTFGTPIRFSLTTGSAGFLLMLVPNLSNIDMGIFWMATFSNSQILKEISERQIEKKTLVLAQYHAYGQANSPDNGPPDINIANIFSTIYFVNTAVSSEVNYNGHRIAIEARPGVLQMSSMLMGVSDLSPVISRLYNFKIGIIIVFILLMLISLFLSSAITNDIVSSVRLLINGMKDVKEGKFSYKINFNRSDEIGRLFTSFNMMVKGLAEKELMGKMISKDAIEKVLGEDESFEPKQIDYVLLFIGVPGFDMYSIGTTAEDLISDLKIQVAEICDAIIKNGGDIDKIIGEKILAVFPCEGDKPQEVVDVTIKMVQKIMATSLPFPISIGVNYGRVISGFLGVGNKRDFTIIGDAVNVTARIESVAENLRFDRCLFSNEIYELCENRTKFTLFGEVDLKGKSERMKLYRLN